MTLREFIIQQNIPRQVVAEALEIKPGYLNHLLTGKRLPSVKLCNRIIEFSGGAVNIYDLRPELEALVKALEGK